jgi:hypothetical protein
MQKIKLDSIKVSGLEIMTNSLHLRRDMHIFIDYVRQRDVKRSYRGNNLSKTDATRLAKLMNNPLKAGTYHGTWIDFIDQLVLDLGFVDYDSKGEYMGYSEPSFRENYINVVEKTYNNFLKMSLQEQENFLLDSLIKEYYSCNNEFYQRTPFTKLDCFDSFGCGVMPTLDFAATRKFLLNLLKDCQSDVWYSTASLVRYLKSHHPYFLIPKNPQVHDKGRYGNFYEHTGSSWNRETTVSENDQDAFERVEGRYVERFLEGIPLTLGYVEVAYGEKACTKKGEELFPALSQLKAFRLKPHFFRVMKGEVAEPKITVQPNFEIHVESDFYPAHTMEALIPLANVVSSDTAIILKLEKKKVASEMVAHENLDVIKLLKHLSGKNLPQNVVTELEEWAGQSDMFTLYDGFGLLEGNVKLAMVDSFTVEQIAPNLRIVKKPNQLFSQLEQAEIVPLKAQHRQTVLSTLPKTAKTVFPKKSAASQTKAKRKQVTLNKQTIVSLYFPDKALLEIFRKDLLEVRCPLEVNVTKQTISFPQAYEKHLKDTIKRINKEYQIQLKNID